jgi:hypothetical protein
MSLTADAFFAYMDKQKQERSEDIEYDQNIIFQEQASMKDQLDSIQKQLTDLHTIRFELLNPPLQVYFNQPGVVWSKYSLNFRNS